MNSPKVMVLSRDYPPHASGGVRRVKALRDALCNTGFDVVTVASAGNPDCKIVSWASEIRGRMQKAHLGRMHRQWMRWVAVPDEHVLDIVPILRATRGIVCDVVIASGPPHSVLLAGKRLAARHGCPWIADFRDAWTDQPRPRPENRLRKAANRALEERVLASACAITVATPSMVDMFRRRAPAATPVLAFVNGYDPHLFEGNAPWVLRPKERIRVGFFGSFYGMIDPEPIARAVARANATFVHAGLDLDGAFQKCVSRYRLVHESLGMLDATRMTVAMRTMDVLTVVVPEDPVWHFVRTQKLAEYLAAGRPILAFAGEGEIAQLVRRYDAGRVVRHDDVEGAARAIAELGRLPSRTLAPLELSWPATTRNVVELVRSLVT